MYNQNHKYAFKEISINNETISMTSRQMTLSDGVQIFIASAKALADNTILSDTQA